MPMHPKEKIGAGCFSELIARHCQCSVMGFDLGAPRKTQMQSMQINRLQRRKVLKEGFLEIPFDSDLGAGPERGSAWSNRDRRSAN